MNEKQQKVDKLFSQWAKASSPGCAIGIMQDGEIVYQQGYGMANLEYNIPITPKTNFHVASVSKQFAAMAIALLADKKQLSLDDEVRQHVANFPDFGEKITIRHLLHHTSGLRDQWELLILAGWRMDDVITTDDVLDLVKHQEKLNFKAGEEFLYSNTGYTLLAYIVKQVSGKSLHEYCDEHIFKPLNMHDSHFHDDYTMIVPNRAYSYDVTESGFKHDVLSYSTVGATSLHTTVGDLLLWSNSFQDDRVWGQDVINAMHTQGILNNGEQIPYALGVVIRQYKGLARIGHDGADAGFRSSLIRFPDQNLSIVVLCNLATMSPGKLAAEIADIYLDDVLVEPEEDKQSPVELTPEQLADKTGIYYKAELGRILRLELHEGALTIMMGSGLSLASLSEDEFHLASVPEIKYQFEETDDGSRQLTEANPSSPFVTYKQMPIVSLSAHERQAYTGTYYSRELDIPFYIFVEDDQIYLHRRKHGTTPLLPAFTDAFTGNIYPSDVFGEGRLSLFFYRGDDNEILGFDLTGGRVRHIRFMRKTSD